MTDPDFPATEGFVSFREYKTWYRIVGEQSDERKLPLVCLHGGPGCPHDYLEPLEAIAATGRQVIFYDQLGCGNSDQPHDPALWTISLFVDELSNLLKQLHMENVHLFGHSWGGMLALEYLLSKKTGIKSLTLASSVSSIPLWIREATRLRSELPAEVQAVLINHEAAGTTESPEYQEAMMVFYTKHICRMNPWPESLTRTFEKLMQNPEVYYTMWGPSEFFATGTLRDWDITARLSEVRLPALLTAGAFDEATPLIIETITNGIENSRAVIFENSGHMAHVEEAEQYMVTLGNFLEEVERS